MDRPCKRSNDCGKVPTWIWCVPSSIWTGFRKKTQHPTFCQAGSLPMPPYGRLFSLRIYRIISSVALCGNVSPGFPGFRCAFCNPSSIAVKTCLIWVYHLLAYCSCRMMWCSLNLRRQGTGTCHPRPRRRGSGSHPRRSAGCPGRNPSQNPSSAGQNRPACSGWWCRWP